jgi:hypothetical protein
MPYKSENSRLKVAIFLHGEDDRPVFFASGKLG